MGVERGTAGPGLTSTSPEEQRRSKIRLRLKTIRTGRLARSEQRVKGMFLGIVDIPVVEDRRGSVPRTGSRRGPDIVAQE